MLPRSSRYRPEVPQTATRASTGRGGGAGASATISSSAGAGFALGLRLLAANLSSVPGRKNVVLFSEGYPYSPQMDVQLKSAVSECNRNDVAVYPMLFQLGANDPTVVMPTTGGRRGGGQGSGDMASAPSAQSLSHRWPSAPEASSIRTPTT